VISRENLHDEGQLREALQTRLGGRAQLLDGLAAISVIGAGINATYDNVLAGSATLAGIGITASGMATSSFRITWLVPGDRVQEAVRALHERYIEQQRPLVP
jgi:aspartate kinase